MSELLGFLTKAFNATEDEITGLLYEEKDGNKVLKSDAIDTLIQKDTERVKRIKESVDTKTIFDNGYKKAQSETLSNFEKDFREKTGYTGDGKGLELIQAWGDTLKKSKIEDVKLHPDYLTLEKAKAAEIENLKSEYEGKITEITSNIERDKRLNAIKSDVGKMLLTFSPVLSENPVIARNRQKDFEQKFLDFDYQLDDSGEHIILKDGKRMEDLHGNPVKFSAFVKEQASLYYEFKEGGKGSGAGNGGSGGQNVVTPKTEEEYHKAISEAKTPEERIAIKTAFDSFRNRK